jgi:hypothetical protein
MSALMGAGALALWLDVDPALDRETDGWYIDEHLPDRTDTGGYLRARRLQALEGGPQYLTLFEAETPQALASAGYLQLVGKISEQSQRIRAGFSNVVRNTFHVRATCGRGLGAVMASLRLRAADDALGRARQAMQAMQPALLAAHGIVGVHWLEAAPEVRASMDAVRVTGLNDAGADYVLLVEATRARDLQALRTGKLSPAALAAQGWNEDAYAVYGFLYEVSSPLAPNEKILGDRT